MYWKPNDDIVNMLLKIHLYIFNNNISSHLCDFNLFANYLPGYLLTAPVIILLLSAFCSSPAPKEKICLLSC